MRCAVFGPHLRVVFEMQLVCRIAVARSDIEHTSVCEREPGENPGLSRSGMQERPPSKALVTSPRLGSDGH